MRAMLGQSSHSRSNLQLLAAPRRVAASPTGFAPIRLPALRMPSRWTSGHCGVARGSADSLHDAAMELPFDNHGIDRHTHIFHHAIVQFGIRGFWNGSSK